MRRQLTHMDQISKMEMKEMTVFITTIMCLMFLMGDQDLVKAISIHRKLTQTHKRLIETAKEEDMCYLLSAF